MRSRCRFLLGNQGRIPPPSTPAYLERSSLVSASSLSPRIALLSVSLRIYVLRALSRFPRPFGAHSGCGQRVRSVKFRRRSTSVLHARNGAYCCWTNVVAVEITHRVGLSSGLAALSTERERKRERKLVGRNRFSCLENDPSFLSVPWEKFFSSLPPPLLKLIKSLGNLGLAIIKRNKL